MKAKRILKGHKWLGDGNSCSCGPVHDPSRKAKSKGRLIKKSRIKRPLKATEPKKPQILQLSWPKAMRAQRCHYCGGKGGTIDHVIPRSQGGQTTKENCVPACAPCNSFRGSKPYGFFKKVGWLERSFAQ